VKTTWGAPKKRRPFWRSPLGDWDPRTDFACAKLHAERLTRLLADEQIAEILLAQAGRHPERRAVLERYLERAEPRARWLHEEITSTGQRLLNRLSGRTRDEEGDAHANGIDGGEPSEEARAEARA
jgi:hypothetical protein